MSTLSPIQSACDRVQVLRASPIAKGQIVPTEAGANFERPVFVSIRDKPTRTMFEYAFIVIVAAVAIVIGIGAIDVVLLKTFHTISLALK